MLSADGLQWLYDRHRNHRSGIVQYCDCWSGLRLDKTLLCSAYVSWNCCVSTHNQDCAKIGFQHSILTSCTWLYYKPLYRWTASRTRDQIVVMYRCSRGHVCTCRLLVFACIIKSFSNSSCSGLSTVCSCMYIHTNRVHSSYMFDLRLERASTGIFLCILKSDCQVMIRVHLC